MSLTADGRVPTLTPVVKPLPQHLSLTLAPYSIAFYVIPKAKVTACQSQSESSVKATLDDLVLTQRGINSIRSRLANINNNLRDRTKIAVDKERTSRQIDTIAHMGQELRKRMSEMQNIIASKGSSSSEQMEIDDNNLRTAERAIDKVAEDFKAVLENGKNQSQEWGKFLKESGLGTTNFAKLMMNEQLSEKGQGEKGRSRKRRDATSAIRNKDLEGIERHYKQLLHKHKKFIADEEKQHNHINFDEINREVKEELILKEITMLERTEETLSEMLKSQKERYEAFEQMMREELEQIKDDKLAQLIEIKLKRNGSKTSPYLNHFEGFNTLLNEEDNLSPRKRETDSEAAHDNQSPLDAFKSFLLKKKEELKTKPAQQKLVELQNKLKEWPASNHLASLLHITPKATTTKPITSVTPIQSASLESATTTDQPVNLHTHKRAADALKYMSDHIDSINNDLDEHGPLEESQETHKNDQETTTTIDDKVKKTITSMLLSHVFRNMFSSKNKPTEKSVIVEQSTAKTTELSGERTLTLPLESLAPEMAADHDQVESNRFKKFREQPGEQAYLYVTTGAPDRTMATSAEPTQSTVIDDSEGKRTRSKRKARSTKTSPSSLKENDVLPNARRAAMAANSIVKKNISTSETPPDNGITRDVVMLADSTLKLFLQKVIPEAYDLAKAEIESLSLPEYLSNLEKIVGNLEYLDNILDRGENPAKHVQKIKRNKRDIQNQLTNEIATTYASFVRTTTENPTSIETTSYEPPEQDGNTNIQIHVMATTASADASTETDDEALAAVKHDTSTEEPQDDEDEDSLTDVADEMRLIEYIANSLDPETTTYLPTPDTSKLLKPQKVNEDEGPVRYARQSALHQHQPLEPPSDDTVSQYLENLQPGVYVVPSKDMENVRAVQTAKTEMGANGRNYPNVVTLNIYYDKKTNQPAEKNVNYPYLNPVAPHHTQKYVNPLSIQQTNLPHSPYRHQGATNWLTGLQPQASLLKSHKYPPAPPNAPLVPQYNYPAHAQANHLQLSPNFSPPSNTWANQFKQSDDWISKNGFEPYSQKELGDEEAEPNSPPDNNSKEYDDNDQKGDQKNSVEPYWNKTLKEIFQATSKDPFWKFLESPELNHLTQEHRADDSYQDSPSRRKRSVSNNYQWSENMLYDLRPFDDKWNIPTAERVDSENPAFKILKSNIMDNNYNPIKQQSVENDNSLRYRLSRIKADTGIGVPSWSNTGDKSSMLTTNAEREGETPLTSPYSEPVGASISQSLQLPLKQIYQMVVDFVRKLVTDAL